MPSLADRRDDIPLLVQHFVEKYEREMRKDVNHDVMLLPLQHDWKREIRELENIIERAIIFCTEEYVALKDLPDFLHGVTVDAAKDDLSLEQATEKFERQYILNTLRKHGFNKEKAASERRKQPAT